MAQQCPSFAGATFIFNFIIFPCFIFQAACGLHPKALTWPSALSKLIELNCFLGGSGPTSCKSRKRVTLLLRTAANVTRCLQIKLQSDLIWLYPKMVCIYIIYYIYIPIQWPLSREINDKQIHKAI